MADFTVWLRIKVPLNEYLQGKFKMTTLIRSCLFRWSKYNNISRYRIYEYFMKISHQSKAKARFRLRNSFQSSTFCMNNKQMCSYAFQHVSAMYWIDHDDQCHFYTSSIFRFNFSDLTLGVRRDIYLMN